MSVIKSKGPIVDPGKCRCCGNLKKCRILNVEYDWMGQTEMYSEMLVDCFGLMLSHLDGEETERLICANCVVRLRDARAFRQQILLCEQLLLNAAVKIHDEGEESTKCEIEVKQEDIEPPTESQQDSDRDVDCDGDNVGEGQIEIKAEELKNEKSVKRKRQSERKKPSETTKLKRMKREVKYIPYDTEYSVQKPKKAIDKDLNTLQNAITIVENSYVCPFTAVFSDYYCVYCREMFVDPIALREHTLKHDPSTYKDFVDNKKLIQIDIEKIDCRLCNETIDNIENLKKHLTVTHVKKFHTDVNNEFMTFKLKNGTVSCIECGKTFGFFHALKKHMAEHFGTFICDICGAHYFEERHLLFHKQNSHSTKNIQTFPCDQCEKTFKSKYSRNFHITRIHKNEPAYPCSKCDEVFISYHMRYRHKIEVHGEKRTFPCEVCNKIYDCRKTLRQHNQKTHLQLLRHECTLCDRKFYLPSALRDHMITHTGERNYRCEFCGKNYPRSKALKVHLQTHSTEKKYKCSLCPSSYTQVTNFKNHMKSKHPVSEMEGYR